MHYRYDELIEYAQSLLTAAGLEHEKAQSVAMVLVEGDLMGHNTHGLALLPGYLGELASGAMEKLGTPTVLADYPAAVTWDGRRLPISQSGPAKCDCKVVKTNVCGGCGAGIKVHGVGPSSLTGPNR